MLLDVQHSVCAFMGPDISPELAAIIDERVQAIEESPNDFVTLEEFEERVRTFRICAR